MNISLRANVAQVVAKLLQRRATRCDELPELVHTVHLALRRLGNNVAPTLAEPAAEVAPARPPRVRRVRAPTVETSEAALAPPPPRLLRRSEVMTSATPSEAAALVIVPGGIVRGIVKWFDARARRGALRLPGQSGDVPVEPALLDEMAIPRLYKGQEVEATMAAGETPRLVHLALPGGGWQVSSAGGVVHDRHAKPVVVEMKREALRRAAARAEAELVLGPGRTR